MTKGILDPEVAALVAVAGTLQAEYDTDEAGWNGSPFAWIKARPSRTVGTIGERLVAGWLASKDFDVARSPDSDADRLVNGRRVEVKFSTLWGGGFYRFQQIRNQNYELVVCLGVSPFNAHCWAIPKTELLDRWNRSVSLGREVDGVCPQHGGSSGRDTAWITVNPSSPQSWLAPYGGTLSAAAGTLTRIAKRR